MTVITDDHRILSMEVLLFLKKKKKKDIAENCYQFSCKILTALIVG